MVHNSFLDINYFWTTNLSIHKYGNYLVNNLNKAQWNTLSSVLQLKKAPHSGFLWTDQHNYIPLHRVKTNLCEKIELAAVQQSHPFHQTIHDFLRQSTCSKKRQRLIEKLQIPNELRWFLGFNALKKLSQFVVFELDNTNKLTSETLSQFFTTKFVNKVYFNQIQFEYNNFVGLLEDHERDLVEFSTHFFNSFFEQPDHLTKSFFEQYYALTRQRERLLHNLKVQSYETKHGVNTYFENLQITRAQQQANQLKRAFKKQQRNSVQLINRFMSSLWWSQTKIKFKSIFNFYKTRILEKRIVAKRIQIKIWLLKELKQMRLLNPDLLVSTIAESERLVEQLMSNIQRLYQQILQLKPGQSLNWKYQAISFELEKLTKPIVLTHDAVIGFLIKSRLAFLQEYAKGLNRCEQHNKLVNELKQNVLLNQNQYKGEVSQSYSVVNQKAVFKGFIQTVKAALNYTKLKHTLDPFNLMNIVQERCFEQLLTTYEKLDWTKYELNQLYFVCRALWTNLHKQTQHFFTKYQFITHGVVDFVFNQGRNQTQFASLKANLNRDWNSPKWKLLVDKTVNKYFEANLHHPQAYLLLPNRNATTLTEANTTTINQLNLKTQLKQWRAHYHLLLQDIRLIQWLYKKEIKQKQQQIKALLKNYGTLNKLLNTQISKVNNVVRKTFFVDSEECDLNRLQASNKLHFNLLNAMVNVISFCLKKCRQNPKKLNRTANLKMLLDNTFKNGIPSWMIFSDLNKINTKQRFKLYLLFKLLLHPQLVLVDSFVNFNKHTYNFTRGLLIAHQNQQGIAYLFNDPHNNLVKDFFTQTINFETRAKN